AATRTSRPGSARQTGTVGRPSGGRRAPVAPPDTTAFDAPTAAAPPDATPPPLLPTTQNQTGTLRVPLPLPLPGGSLTVPPLLPGLPGVGIGQ
ncbi:MAG TPA: hypothetical protein VJX10_04095, partial [Pseudonocardiaceae bacterium]|nr:hypothetical protein [Pseudonocardiaceae bacterium]